MQLIHVNKHGLKSKLYKQLKTCMELNTRHTQVDTRHVHLCSTREMTTRRVLSLPSPPLPASLSPSLSPSHCLLLILPWLLFSIGMGEALEIDNWSKRGMRHVQCTENENKNINFKLFPTGMRHICVKYEPISIVPTFETALREAWIAYWLAHPIVTQAALV